jgi:hypothetical protein
LELSVTVELNKLLKWCRSGMEIAWGKTWWYDGNENEHSLVIVVVVDVPDVGLVLLMLLPLPYL